LQRISFLGHSMGGLLARHAIGEAHASRAAALLIPNTPCL
jgi:alpha-beta hydrolase superfamily lysophospholipase